MIGIGPYLQVLRENRQLPLFGFVTSFSSSTRASILRIFLSLSFWLDEPPLLLEPFFMEPPWTMVAEFRALFGAGAQR